MKNLMEIRQRYPRTKRMYHYDGMFGVRHKGQFLWHRFNTKQGRWKLVKRTKSTVFIVKIDASKRRES